MFKLLVQIVEFIRHYYGRLYIRYISKTFGCYLNNDISYPINIKNPGNIFLQKGTRIGPRCKFGAFKKIQIGKDVIISSDCIIETGYLKLDNHYFGNNHLGKEILISDNVWIGTGSIILAGVYIGENSFVAAGSVVSKNIPANSIYKNGEIYKRNFQKNESKNSL